MPSIRRCGVVLSGMIAVLNCAFSQEARAVGVLYADPGWLHAYDGDSDYYHDPDGYNPDYVHGNATNQPGGRTDFPALIDPGPCGTDDACKAAAIWQNRGSEWDGSAPGDPLGGVAGSPPPLPPAAPGGVGAFTDAGGGASFLRLQDPGLPGATVWGWADKNAQACSTCPRQEGNNRRIEFVHEMDRDNGFSGTEAILNNGVTLSFRARIATAATGPIDAIYPEEGPPSTPWPSDGYGYSVANNGRGMVMISQGSFGGATPEGRLAFSLIDTNTIAQSQSNTQPIAITQTGLIMNNRSNPSGSPDTNEATAATANVFEIDNAALVDWHEFWITVQALPAPVSGNTHEVNVYADGSLTPETFQVILGDQNEAGSGSYLGIGLASGSRWGAFDLDFIAYKEGVHAPVVEPAGVAGDFNDDGTVDAADYVVWRKNLGTTNALPNDDQLGTPIGPSHLSLWRANFGESSPGGGSGTAAAPEPSAFVLLSLASICIGLFGRRRGAGS
jgi:hypothetical protein